ncbi:MAG: hypothetical protein GKR92_09890 [Gammaproteobacteria bacterium]|nr:MAG: hypothetical protein GKR92_09890 [Gammaproteobacteria bacterium]
MHDKDATPIEAIDFETLQESAEKNKESTPGLSKKSILWFVFVSLLLCALIVFFFLPKYVAENRNKITPENQTQVETLSLEEPSQAVEEEPEPLISLSPEESSAFKQQAEELLLEIIGKQKFLENKAVKKWANEEFKIALEQGSRGDEHFRKQAYQQSIAAYEDAAAILMDLERQVEPTLTEHLAKGGLALTQAEKDTAIIHFELAKSIDTSNTQAINGLRRAETIKELYALLVQGGKYEAANRFVDAKTIYQQATDLDPLSPEAKTALDRVSNRLAQNEFNRLINQGYTLLKKHQYSDARTAFTTAQKLAPNSEKPKQGIVAIEQAIRNERLSALAAEAQHFENIQDWSNAIESYQQMLTLSSNLPSALQGLERSRQRETILARLDEHINNKLRLGSDQIANKAKRLLEEISSINNPGSKIEQSAATLSELIKLADQPVSITLQSDNQTDIVIFKVGKYGKFNQRSIELKTGKYTIVGSRAGFRDVRKVLTVSSDMSSKIISVQCDEPI